NERDKGLPHSAHGRADREPRATDSRRPPRSAHDRKAGSMLRRSLHAQASGEIFGTIDVAEDAGVVAVDELDGGARALQEFARAGVTGEALEAAAEPRRESDGMPALAPPRGRNDRRARGQPLDDAPDRFRTNERHVGKRDHPAVRVPGSANGMGE